MEVSAEQLKAAVESQHGGKAVFVTKVPVKEMFDELSVWEGTVHIFDLEGHPRATMAYAWSSPVEGSARRAGSMHLGGIRSPLDAVRAAIVAERRAKAK